MPVLLTIVKRLPILKWSLGYHFNTMCFVKPWKFTPSVRPVHGLDERVRIFFCRLSNEFSLVYVWLRTYQTICSIWFSSVGYNNQVPVNLSVNYFFFAFFLTSASMSLLDSLRALDLIAHPSCTTRSARQTDTCERVSSILLYARYSLRS